MKVLYRLVRLISLPLIVILEPLGYVPSRIAAMTVLVISAMAWDCVSLQHSTILTTAIWIPGVMLWYLFIKWGGDFENRAK